MAPLDLWKEDLFFELIGLFVEEGCISHEVLLTWFYDCDPTALVIVMVVSVM